MLAGPSQTHSFLVSPNTVQYIFSKQAEDIKSHYFSSVPDAQQSLALIKPCNSSDGWLSGNMGHNPSAKKSPCDIDKERRRLY